MSNATQLHSHSGVALQILSRTALNITQTNSHTVIHCSEQVPCPVITAIQFTFTPHYKKINCSNFRKQNSKASTQTTKSRLHMQLTKFPFLPYNLLLELILISVFLFMFTATTVTMLLLLYTPFLPLCITNITSCKSWFNN
jgi:hypothetical protein